jgi:hypothetical protein
LKGTRFYTAPFRICLRLGRVNLFIVELSHFDFVEFVKVGVSFNERWLLEIARLGRWMRLAFKLERKSARMHQPLIVRNVLYDLISDLLWPSSWHSHDICDKSLRDGSVLNQVVRL